MLSSLSLPAFYTSERTGKLKVKQSLNRPGQALKGSES
jgi:predicted nucleic acid-binding Zn ribbon protein